MPLNKNAPAPFFEVVGKKTNLFDVETCDSCGKECIAPNSVGGTTADVAKYKSLGMKERKAPSSELNLNDDGDAVCDSCLSDDSKVAAVKTALLERAAENAFQNRDPVLANALYDQATIASDDEDEFAGVPAFDRKKHYQDPKVDHIRRKYKGKDVDRPGKDRDDFRAEVLKHVPDYKFLKDGHNPPPFSRK